MSRLFKRVVMGIGGVLMPAQVHSCKVGIAGIERNRGQRLTIDYRTNGFGRSISGIAKS
jgi:hypothetical protein